MVIRQHFLQTNEVDQLLTLVSVPSACCGLLHFLLVYWILSHPIRRFSPLIPSEALKSLSEAAKRSAKLLNSNYRLHTAQQELDSTHTWMAAALSFSQPDCIHIALESVRMIWFPFEQWAVDYSGEDFLLQLRPLGSDLLPVLSYLTLVSSMTLCVHAQAAL